MYNNSNHIYIYVLYIARIFKIVGFSIMFHKLTPFDIKTWFRDNYISYNNIIQMHISAISIPFTLEQILLTIFMHEKIMHYK